MRCPTLESATIAGQQVTTHGDVFAPVRLTGADYPFFSARTLELKPLGALPFDGHI